MASQFLPFIAHSGGTAGGADPYVDEVTFLSTDTSQPMDLVFFDTADNNVKICGADPANILGFCLGNAPASIFVGSALTGKPQPYATNKTPVAILDSDVIVGLSSPTTPSLAHVTRSYGVALVTAGGRHFWQLDTTDVVNTRVKVVRVDIPNGIFFVRFLPANLQGQSVLT